jgi:hypothetical protein
MQKLFIDYVGKFPRSKAGNTAILVCVDAFTKFFWLLPFREITSRATIKVLKERVFASFSVPEILISDNAQYFNSREFKNFCFEMGMKHVTTSLYYPQPSHAERFNRNLRAALIAYHWEAHDTWDQQLTWLQVAFNTAEHESTKAYLLLVCFLLGQAHHFSISGKFKNFYPIGVTRGHCSDVGLKSNIIFVRVGREWSRNITFVALQIRSTGDIVYYKNHPISNAGKREAAKLMPRFKGPFGIGKILTPVTAELVDPESSLFVTKTQVSLLKLGSVSNV